MSNLRDLRSAASLRLSRTRSITVVSAAGLLLAASLSGCMSAASGEKNARSDVAAVGSALGVNPAGMEHRISVPFDRSAALAALRADSPETDFIRFAVYNHPAVRAAYYDWKASVEAIAPARALPDPQFTFQADITDTLMSFMPGLMFDFMGAGKRAAMAREASATSNVAYRAYVAEVVKTAAAARKAWVELAYAQDVDRLYRQTIHAAEQAVALAGADYTTGQGMTNFDQQVRAQNTLAEHHAHHASVAEQRAAAKAKFKSALGLLPTDPDPVWPEATLAVTNLPSETEIWEHIVAANPDLTKMRSMVEMAVAGVDVARTGGRPDFSLGAMVDLKQNPLMYRPTATVTLPVWREKIRANIAAAEARRDAAASRVTAEELNMAAQLAQMLYMVREADNMLAYIDRTALPNLDRSLASAEATAQSGMGSATMIAEVQMMAIDMRHERLDALREREDNVVDLALMTADVLPDQAPLVAGSMPAAQHQ